MKPQKFIIIIIAIIVLCFGKDGKPFLGEIPPSDGEAKIFAPGIASNGMNNRDITFMPDGKEIYFCASFGNFNYSAIMFVKQKKMGNGLNQKLHLSAEIWHTWTLSLVFLLMVGTCTFCQIVRI